MKIIIALSEIKSKKNKEKVARRLSSVRPLRGLSVFSPAAGAPKKNAPCGAID
jgi:hypothetical protein